MMKYFRSFFYRDQSSVTTYGRVNRVSSLNRQVDMNEFSDLRTQGSGSDTETKEQRNSHAGIAG
jgi:hypothetical protein